VKKCHLAIIYAFGFLSSVGIWVVLALLINAKSRTLSFLLWSLWPIGQGIAGRMLVKRGMPWHPEDYYYLR
jgi:hypothetical protein